MVKADAHVNYYKVLGVSPNADEGEVRKAFRQLALKCHPDRNPGRESEYVAKFQDIQAAHEILSDSAQRAKYDAERRKLRNLNIPPYNQGTPRRPPPPPRTAYTTTTPSGSYYRAPPPKPSPQRPPPPQHHTTFANGADRFTSKNFRAPPPPTAPRPDARDSRAPDAGNVFTAWQKMKQPRGEPRAYNPNNPNGTPFGRSTSTRVPSSKHGFDPGTPGQDEGQARSAYRSNYERPDPSPPVTEDPLKHFKARMSNDEVPFAEANRVRTPYYSTAAGERTSMFEEGVGRSASVRNSPTHSHRPTSSADPGAYSDSGRRPQRNSYGGHGAKPRFPEMYSDSSDSEFEAALFRAAGKHRGPPPPKESPQQQPARTPGFGTPQKPSPGNGPSPNPFKSRSEESINMKFSPSDWHGKFEGKPDYFAPNVQKVAAGKGRTSPTRGRQAQRVASERLPFSGQSQPPPPVSSFPSQVPPPPPPPPPQAPFPNGSASTSHAAAFAPEAWAETFKEPSWAYPVKPKDTSPRRGSTAAKRANPSRKASVVPDVKVNGDNKDKAKPKHQAFAEEVANGDDDAMDIDPSTPPVETTKPSVPGSGAASVPHQDQGTPRTGTVPNGNATASPSATATKSADPGLDGLADLTKVTPFAQATNGGLSDVDPLKDALPNESQASDVHPTKPNTARKLRLPPMPKAPDPPTTLSQIVVDGYLKRMETYVREFKNFSKTMTAHFAGRTAELDGLDMDFIHQRGETTKKLGFASYVNKMKEDERIMEAWKYAQEQHIKSMEQCREVRNKTMKLYLNAG